MLQSTATPKERALAVAVRAGSIDRAIVSDHLAELVFLAETAGAEIIETIVQELPRPVTATYIGSGKVQEVKEIVEEEEIGLVIFDDDLSPAQVKNLENQLEVKVIDRSGLILDIFAAHARSNEAKTQVELAQLQYLLPRLSRMWTHLSKQYGGIGMKGPGETQIETDRRLIRHRITQLKVKLEKIATQKRTQRKGRSALTRFALVGYTNAGKSTLMNLLSDSEVYVRDKLFATLDTTVRTIEFVGGKQALLSDTVGFIRKLPTHLVASFRSTLAEIEEADILLHVVDISHPAVREHIEAVHSTLKQLEVDSKPVIMVYNKIDKMQSGEELQEMLQELPSGSAISAARGINIRDLKATMQRESEKRVLAMDLLFPYTAMQHLARIYEIAEVMERRDLEAGIAIKAKVDPRYAEQLVRWQNTASPSTSEMTD